MIERIRRIRKLGGPFIVIVVILLIVRNCFHDDLSQQARVNRPRIQRVLGEKNKFVPWVRISSIPDHVFMYSAFFDADGFNQYIRITGIGVTDYKVPLLCQLWDKNLTLLTQVPVVYRTSIDSLFNGWQLHKTCYMICHLNAQDRPAYVSVRRADDSHRLAIPTALPVIYQDRVPGWERRVGVCVNPFHKFKKDAAYSGHQPARFIEWLEFHKLLGVTNFRFYDLDNSVDPFQQCIIDAYPEIEILHIDLLPHLGQYYSDDGRYYAYMTTNDCMYRYKGSAKYAMQIDFDEFIVPYINASSYFELIDEIEQAFVKAATDQVGAYIFRQAHFYTFWEDDKTEVVYPTNYTAVQQVENLITRRKTTRTVPLTKDMNRMKYICKPESVFEPCFHRVCEYKRGFKVGHVPPRFGALHHYRDAADGLVRGTVADKSAHKYLLSLGQRVKQKLDEVVAPCLNAARRN